MTCQNIKMYLCIFKTYYLWNFNDLAFHLTDFPIRFDFFEFFKHYLDEVKNISLVWFNKFSHFLYHSIYEKHRKHDFIKWRRIKINNVYYSLAFHFIALSKERNARRKVSESHNLFYPGFDVLPMKRIKAETESTKNVYSIHFYYCKILIYAFMLLNSKICIFKL